MSRKIAFINALEEDIKFINFFKCLPEYEIALIADDRRNSEVIKYAEKHQIRTSATISDINRMHNIDIIAVLSYNDDMYKQIYYSAKNEQTVLNRNQLVFLYDVLQTMISSKYSFVENNFLQNTKEIKTAISDFGIITKNIDILAINASIEAARAGESGKGFAVVASNIKDLVKSSREMLIHIKSILEKFTLIHRQMIELREMLSFDDKDKNSVE